MATERIRQLWYVLMPVAGFCFGLLSLRKPFGAGLLTHPIVLYLAAVALALVLLRLLASRPASEIIPDRALMTGLVSGIGAYIVGNFLVDLFV
ncbi:MAG TPA: hypothetical protein VNQ56_12445 [Pseudolabrys sp.]|nr:hypothetical protein [Pseudolabrys sp.]